jgi:spore coat polysaccharide biosynthesis protein SpsF (cytidylyltransferase family)|tara:strand:+ start:977 stop:1747 length:771 start_codon:yes stop_codon:yes gene_type:complete
MSLSEKITCIIQARTGSKRFPNKVLEEIENLPMICHIINRIKKAKKVNQIILATSNTKSDKILLDIAKKFEIIAFAGSENDVLDRFFNSAKLYAANPIIRITGDCPLVDPVLLDNMIDFFQKSDYDYVSNTIDRTFPDGLDIEIFSFETLKKSHDESKWSSEREHVTPYILKNKNKFKMYNYRNTQNLSNLRWSVDEKNDLLMIKQIFQEMRPNQYFSTEDVLKILSEKPNISKINSNIEINEGYKKSLQNDRMIK